MERQGTDQAQIFHSIQSSAISTQVWILQPKETTLFSGGQLGPNKDLLWASNSTTNPLTLQVILHLYKILKPQKSLSSSWYHTEIPNISYHVSHFCGQLNSLTRRHMINFFQDTLVHWFSIKALVAVQLFDIQQQKVLNLHAQAI